MLGVCGRVEGEVMKVWLYHRSVENTTERVVCCGKNKEELNKDVFYTLKILNWDKAFCWTEEIYE